MACVVLLKFTFLYSVYNVNSDMNLYPFFFFHFLPLASLVNKCQSCVLVVVL